jgi:hypothetical protein
MNKIKLYHYSNKDFTGYIKPLYFGLNSYTGNSKALSTVERTYYYTTASHEAIESSLLGSKYKYITEVSKKDLYILESCKLAGYDIYFEALKAGYKGIISGNIAVLFYQSKIIKRIE